MNPQPLEATGGSEAGFEWNPYFNSYEKGQREETAPALVETHGGRVFERHRQNPWPHTYPPVTLVIC